ncbi:stage II sporulation protein M [Saxibacter everestensis]|uniref:Stage II sporulation protein M n=1 Tax=Saxibacter everestensis TaxID=2909229 RepID=A0ABY8QPG9_9MICO|nr:stage II sporulation protein M [Brevibacteriaceae bacterium ZFBP1038]
MDLDAFVLTKRESWQRLETLAKQRNLSGAEADELMNRYQHATTDLSVIRSTAPESSVSIRLSGIIARTRTKFTGTPGGAFAGIGRFFVVSFPVALYRLRWLTLGIGLAFVLIAALTAAWVANNPEVQQALAPEAALKAIAEHDFVAYYSENPASSFAAGVWTNNAWIAAQWIALGITGVFVIYGLISNAVNVGIMAGILFAFDYGTTFFTYILPHGIPELTSIFIAAAAGLRIFWAWVVPGPRTRVRALAEEGRSLFTVALGLVLVLFLSGLVEAYVTPSSLPVPVRIGIGVIFFIALWTYAIALGRRAARDGETGDLERQDAGDERASVG